MTVSTTRAPLTGSDVFERDALYIAGRWVDAGQRNRIPVIDPFTEEVIGSFPEAIVTDADVAVAAAVDAFRSSPWMELSFAERAEHLVRISDELGKRKNEIVEAYVHDLGGRRAHGENILARTQLIFSEHVAFAAQIGQKDDTRTIGGVDAIITRDPVGPILAIVPWNGPLLLAAVKIAPALLAGCPVVVKVAPESAITSFVLAEAIHAAGVPQGMISFLPGERRALGDIAARKEFRHISFTGSTASGTKIMETAAQNITGVTLELGGKSAAIILDDVNPAEISHLVLAGSMGQSGQVCTTYSRLLVPADREPEWRSALAELFTNLRVGDPDDPATEIGPLISQSHRDTVEGYIAVARQEGATILAGGGRPDHQPTGFFVEPTLVGDVTPDMRIVREEVFGPVIVLQSYESVDQAVDMANDTDFGLAAGIFTNDNERGIAIARRLEAGSVSVNTAAACVLMPFGGYKKSGLGREGGPEGVEELLEIKQIQIGKRN